MKKLSNHLKRRAFCVLSAFALLAVSGPAALAASGYPDRPITIVVGYPAGGSVDLNGRVVADTLARKIGAKVVVENLGGAGGTIGAQKVIRAKPDGYTLLVGSLNEIVIASLVNPAVKYNGVTDLQAIGLIGDQPLVLAASKKTDIRNTADLVKVATSGKSENYSYGSSGVGTSLHMAGEMVNAETRAKFLHVPYRGVAPLVTDLTSGRLPLGVFALSSALPQIQSGQITAIGVTSAKRSAFASDIPAWLKTPLSRPWISASGLACSAPRTCPRRSSKNCRPVCSRCWPTRSFRRNTELPVAMSCASSPIWPRSFRQSTINSRNLPKRPISQRDGHEYRV